MHQNNISRNIVFVTNTMRLHFCISDGDRQVVHGDMIIVIRVFGTRDLFNISYSRELYLFSKFLHFEEIVRVKIAVHFEIIVIKAYTTF